MRLRVVAPTVLSLFAFTAATVTGQETGAPAIYKAQLAELHTKVLSVAERVRRAAETSVTSRNALNDELLVLLKLVHRLSEASSGDSGELRRTDESALLLVALGGEALSFEIGALMNFVKTGDRVFLALQRDAETLYLNTTRSF